MFSLATLVILSAMSLAQVVPTAPGPGQTFTAGGPCTIKWQPDTTGTWNTLTIDLMSGSNDNMSFVTNVVFQLDGTSLSSYAWPCPELEPYSTIYFYQFNQTSGEANTNLVWTTRFAIVSANGASTAPEHSTQPNGDAVPWGVGQLLSTNAKDATTSTTSSTTATNAVDHALPAMSPMKPSAASSVKSAPEVTLNVPPPGPRKYPRRSGLSKVYMGNSNTDNFSRRAASTIVACKSRRGHQSPRL